MIALFPNCAFLSETSRMLEIARALRARGEGVALASQGGPYEGLLDESGLPWTRLAPGMGREEALDFVRREVSMGFGADPLHSRAFLHEAVRAEAELLRDLRAEMVVVGFDIPSFLSSRVAGVPLATSHCGSWVPPVFERGLTPAPVKPPAAVFRLLPEPAARWLANLLPPRSRKPVAFLNAVADELGVERVPSVAAAMCGDLTLVTDVPQVLGIPRAELEAWRPDPRRYRPSTRLRYVGPMFARLDRPVPEEVEAFLDGGGPVVYVAPTSVTRELLVDLVRAVRATGARTLVASTLHDIRELEDEETCIADVLPNHRVMPRVDLAVTMGGQGSVQCAMTSGIPLVGFPLQPEQELNVALAERQGMGLRLPPRDAGTPQVTRAVEALLSDPGARRNALRVRSLYEGVDGPANAAEAIATELGRGGSRPS